MDILGSPNIDDTFQLIQPKAFVPPPRRHDDQQFAGMQPITPPGVTLRSFDDVATTRKLLYDNVLKATQSIQPMENNRYRLALTDVHYADPDARTIADRKKAILNGDSLLRRIRGTWVLTRKDTGEEVERRKQTIVNVPHMTEAGTFVYRGTDYSVNNQQRLRPGIYARIKENGEIESHANILPGDGVAHRYFLDPEKGAFYLRIQQAKIPLMPLVRALGATDKQLREAWGDEILAANYPLDTPVALKKLVQKVARNAAPDADPIKTVAEAFRKMRIDPDVVKETLGKPYQNIDLDLILDSTKKLLSLSRGEVGPDDRDHLAYQHIMGPEDLFAERIAKDYGRMQRQLLFKASFGGLKSIPTAALDRQLHSVLTKSGLAQSLEEINAGEILDKLTKVTRMGEGGLGSVDVIPDEARTVQPSHAGAIDPVRTPESLRAGVDLNFASGARKGSDGRIYIQVFNHRKKQLEYVPAQALLGKTLKFPGSQDDIDEFTAAMVNGRLRYVPKDRVDYELPYFENAFSPLSAMVPMKGAVKGQRVAMGSRMLTQALPLEEPEAPLVQAAMPEDPSKSFEDHYGGHMGALRAEKPGTVMEVNKDSMVVRHADGSEKTYELYDNLPHSRKTLMHHHAMVQPGQYVEAGSLLARSSYTDKSGTTALGKNLSVAYVPWRGLNHEDAAVISETAAKKLTSTQMYQHGLDWSPEYKQGKSEFISLFPQKYDRAQLETLDHRGVIKPGTVVNYDDPLILAARERPTTAGKVHKKGQASWTDLSIRWEHHTPGVVTDVAVTKNGANVIVKSAVPTQTGDKIAGRYGDKSIIADVLPDEQMPQLPDGSYADIAVNPLGVISRVNPAQIVEAVLGKIAAKTGKPYKVPDFKDIDDLVEFGLSEMRKHGIKDVEHIVDPETGRKINDVLVGNRFFMKLHHVAESKLQGRSTGGYTQFGEPAKGGSSGSKKLSLLDSNALLSHGATGVLQDAHLVRGQRHDDGFWLSFMQGNIPAKPKVPMVFQKFVNELKASGINVVPEGNNLNVMALTDKDISHLAEDREITNAETVNFDKEMRPIPGGFFDPQLTGGNDGNRWSFIRLAEPMPSPVFEEPIRRILGLTEKKYLDVLAGREELPTGTGPLAIQKALDQIDLPKEIAQARMAIAGSRKTARDTAVRKLGFLKSAQQLGIHPRDWMLTKVPVLPPRFRPVSVMSGSGQPLISDMNYLYAELFNANSNLKELANKVDDVGDERLAVYHAFKAAVGLEDPVHPKLAEKHVTGLLKQIFGSSPKSGTVQRRLLASSTDLVGRGTIIPDPNLDMDSIGVPEAQAWEIYKPFVVRSLRRKGMPLSEAARHVKEKTALGRRELLDEMARRPVIANRAPVLHRFGVMAFWPKLVKGDAIKTSPLIVSGFGADYNGDSVKTALLPVLVNDKLFIGTFDEFINTYVLYDYMEDKAVERFGRQTTVFQFAETANVRVPGVELDGTVGWRPVSHISIHTSHGPDCYNITTERGLDAVFTAHHNFVALNDDCELVPVKTTEVAAGSLLPIVFNCEPDVVHDAVPGRKDIPLNYRTGFFLGHWLGDGSLTGCGDTVSQASSDKRLLRYLERCGTYFTSVYPWYEGNGKSVRWTDTEFYSWLYTEFGKNWDRKRVPGWCITSPRSFREGFFLGFLSAEGSYKSNNITIELGNRPILLAMQMVANSIGIPSTLRKGKPERKSKVTTATLAPTYVLSISPMCVRDSIALWPKIDRVRRFGAYDGTGSRQKWDSVPYPALIAKKIDDISGSYRGGKGRWAKRNGRVSAHKCGSFVAAGDRRYSAERGACLRSMALKVIDQYSLREVDDPVLQRWIAFVDNRQLIWDVIKEVNKVDRPDVTYDFHVPGSETFCVDGYFITHNTMQLHVPVTSRAVDDAVDRMLPSKNLLKPSDMKSPIHIAGQEYVGGLYAATKPDKNGRVHKFHSAKDAVAAYRSGSLPANAIVEILDT